MTYARYDLMSRDDVLREVRLQGRLAYMFRTHNEGVTMRAFDRLHHIEAFSRMTNDMPLTRHCARYISFLSCL